MVSRHRNVEMDMLDSEPRPYPYTYSAPSYDTYGTSPYDNSSSAALARSATYPHHSMTDAAVPPAAVERSASDNGGVMGTFDMGVASRANSRPPLRVANVPDNTGIGLRDIKDPALFSMPPPAVVYEGPEHTNVHSPYVHEDAGMLEYPRPVAVNATPDHRVHAIARVPPPVYTEE